MDKISIIMPIYNVDKYLQKSLDTVINQTYSNLEIILVDDGSTDESGRICDEYEKKDERIRVIHKENGGLSDARNAGLTASTGKLIGFVDPDDYIDLNMYSILVDALKRESAEIAFCGYMEVGNRSEVYTFENRVYTKAEAMKGLLRNQIPSFAWNKLYKRELFDNLRFKVGFRYEDVRIMHKIFVRAEKVVSISAPQYFYYIRDDSITGQTKFENAGEFVKSLEQRCEDLQGTEYLIDAQYGEYACLRRLIYEIIIHKEPKTDFYEQLLVKSKILHKKVKKNCSITGKVVGLLFSKSPEIYSYLRFCCKKILNK